MLRFKKVEEVLGQAAVDGIKVAMIISDEGHIVAKGGGTEWAELAAALMNATFGEYKVSERFVATKPTPLRSLLFASEKVTVLCCSFIREEDAPPILLAVAGDDQTPYGVLYMKLDQLDKQLECTKFAFKLQAPVSTD